MIRIIKVVIRVREKRGKLNERMKEVTYFV